MTREQLLHNVPFFRALSADDISALAHKLEEVRINTGDVIVHEGEVDSTSLFITPTSSSPRRPTTR